jgi:outer membrane protein OmpA-like peptidoglycan-associated protein
VTKLPQLKDQSLAINLNGNSDSNTAAGLQSIYFNYKKLSPDKPQQKVLDDNIKLLLLHPEISITLESHCDAFGNDGYNDQLAFKRAEFTAIYLKSKGIYPERLAIKIAGSKFAKSISSILDTNEIRQTFNKERRINFIISSLSTIIYTPSLQAPSILLPNGHSDLKEAGGIQSVFFNYKKTTIDNSQRDLLSKNLLYLKQNPNISFAIEVHCDSRGGSIFNTKLADKRYQFIKSYFVNKGIKAIRISKMLFVPSPSDDIFSNNLSPSLTSLKEFQYNFNKERRVNFIITSLSL